MKRFYKDVSVAEAEGGWQVELDGRAIRTQSGGRQIVPTQALAQMLAAEWRAQGEEIDPKSFVYRDMADFALDVVAKDRGDTIGKLLSYAETDTLCYRAAPGEPLFDRQEEIWEPLVRACEARHGMRLERITGVIHQKQADGAIIALRERLESEDNFALAGLLTLTSLAASLVVGLAMLEDGANAEALFAAANAEEDWQAELWGWDHAAEEVRAARLEAFKRAAAFVAASRKPR
ncbi:ATP12 family chaperone protein [Aurantiacibacter gangjinensis]|uniref:Molecular chaperone n=1 Tax=Aurantiacibacter gangjinensis TaxID=502682 RepID=A0A0G9MW65_9SPHN|nr:ATP12 family protein [Aurantiacibacter gangjinensis]APE27100.1 Chaperone required for the assembly of the mitochondrial F1-ATPase [Aurantiacibacter gangjinensis]KLE33518.1 molecular chaperone [Aurantiacibacter gangjinensis]